MLQWVALKKLVLIRVRVHLFPFRTQQLSSLLPTILEWRRSGKIGSANTSENETCFPRFASIAQSVEHAAVNRAVVGSSPSWGAIECRHAAKNVAAFLLKYGPLAQLVRASGS